ncbi:MAG: M20/M25/M40 family metallo-hydrolase [Proteobacteria bacterium]|nr:M20/M25/M40 family metallo-hydrolase [Pseudomonadota bacterium]
MRRLLLFTPLLILATACGPVHQPPNTALPTARTAWHQAVDWDSAGAEATSVLAGYLQTDTRNPPGLESAGARYIAGVLQREGIPYQLMEHAPGRASLVARVAGDGSEAPLCLMSHIDVVPWELESWPEDTGPLSGTIDEDGILWGRGALDMKGLGALELMTLVWLNRLQVPLKRDVVLLAVADEEVDGGGARMIADEYWDDIGCSHMINEGGLGIRGVFFDDQTVYAISVAEKGVLWLRMIASGDPGHGSTPRPDEAPDRLRDALVVLDEEWDPEPQFDPALDELFFRVGDGRGGLSQAVLTHPQAVRSILAGRLMGNPATAAMITNTVHLTGMEGANQPNVIPGEVSALLDCRIQPGTSPIEVLAEIQAIFEDMPWIRFEVLNQFAGNGSPYDDPFFATLAKHMVDGRDDAVAGPIVSVGFTDSIHFRALGVHAYGIVPFEVTGDDLKTMHGNGERVSVANVHDGLRKLFAAVVDFTAADGGSPPAAAVAAPEWSPVVPIPEEHTGGPGTGDPEDEPTDAPEPTDEATVPPDAEDDTETPVE